MEKQTSLIEIWKLLKKRYLFVVSVFLLSVSVTVAVSMFLLTPIYEASTQMLINQKKLDKNQLNAQDIETNLQLINTYNVIIKSPVILAKVIEELELDIPLETLEKNISIKNQQNSQVINIQVENPSRKKAVAIANKTAEVFQEEISNIMSVDNVIILYPANEKRSMDPTKPNLLLNTALASILGLLLGVGITVLREYFNTTIKTEEDLSEFVDYPFLGLVSTMSSKSKFKSKKR